MELYNTKQAELYDIKNVNKRMRCFYKEIEKIENDY